MAKPFSVETEESRFRLPLRTREQIAALMRDLDQDARSVIIIAIDELWRRECGTPERDVFAELDELREKVAALEQIAAGGYEHWFAENRDRIGL